MPQSCYYRLGCFGPDVFFFPYQSQYKTATCINTQAALFPVLVSSATSKHVTGAYEIILAQVLITRSKLANYGIYDALCVTVYPQGSFLGTYPFLSLSVILLSAHTVTD